VIRTDFAVELQEMQTSVLETAAVVL